MKFLIALYTLLLSACLLEPEKAPDQEIPVTCTPADTVIYQDSTAAHYHAGTCIYDELKPPGAK